MLEEKALASTKLPVRGSSAFLMVRGRQRREVKNGEGPSSKSTLVTEEAGSSC